MTLNQGNVKSKLLFDNLAGIAPVLLLIGGLLFQFRSLMGRYGQPVLGMFEFRETQTAISAYWMTQGGPKIIYETPVLGAPWTIPFEFPFFQWIVALLSSLTPIPVDSSARLVSFVFFLLVLWICYKLSTLLDISKRLYLIFAGLLCFSPLYLYWTSTSMIESTALFLALTWLYFYLHFLKTDNTASFLLAVLFGVMAALEKITTFPAIVFIGFVLTCAQFWPELRDSRYNPFSLIKLHWKQTIGLILSVLIPILATQIWVHYADAAKAQSDMGAAITSEALRHFNFGKLAHRTDPATWKDIIYGRALLHILGDAWFIILLLAAAFLRERRDVVIVAVCFAAYTLAPLLFIRLHMIHYYYQYANGFFLVLATAVVANASFKRQALLTIVAMSCVLFSMDSTYKQVFGPYLNPSKSGNYRRTVLPANWIKENTAKDSALYVFGIDWSSQVHLYAQRKGVAARRGLSYKQVEDMLEDPQKYTGGLALDSVLVCDRAFKDWADTKKAEKRVDLLNTFIATRTFVKKYDGCSLYR